MSRTEKFPELAAEKRNQSQCFKLVRYASNISFEIGKTSRVMRNISNFTVFFAISITTAL